MTRLNVPDPEGGHQPGCPRHSRGRREAKGRSSEAMPTKTAPKSGLTRRRKRVEKEEERV